MSHPIRTTDAIVIDIETEGEANIVAHCLTRDLGRIYLHVQAAKKMESKHRSMFFPLASITIDCVEGKSIIRCTGVTERERVYQDIRNLSVVRRNFLQNIFSMVHRLVPTHIPVDEVFTTYEIFYRLCLDQSFSDSDLAILCLIAQLRILGILGYWNSDWTDEVLHTTGKTFEYVSQNKRSVEKLIERILVDTQMVIKGFQE